VLALILLSSGQISGPVHPSHCCCGRVSSWSPDALKTWSLPPEAWAKARVPCSVFWHRHTQVTGNRALQLLNIKKKKWIFPQGEEKQGEHARLLLRTGLSYHGDSGVRANVIPSTHQVLLANMAPKDSLQGLTEEGRNKDNLGFTHLWIVLILQQACFVFIITPPPNPTNVFYFRHRFKEPQGLDEQ
jgi:hypothetical protein